MIDQENQETWPAEVREAMSRFKQGHLIERPPFFYRAVPRYGVWGPTRSLGSDSAQIASFAIAPDDPHAPPYGILTSQTCDINEQSPRPKQPWVQIAPVYDMSQVLDEPKKGRVERYEIGYLAKLAPPALPPRFWVADLRIQLPLEKSCFVGRKPIEAFDQEEGYLRFADHLARRIGRPALANVLSSTVVQSLRKAFAKLKARERETLLPLVEELLLEVDPTREAPTSARLTVVTKSDPPAAEVRRWFDHWHEQAAKDTQRQDLLLFRPRYATLDSLSARSYLRAVPLDFRYLSPDEEGMIP